MITEKLKPCPFCGCKELNVSKEDWGRGLFQIRMESWWLQCQGEHCYAFQQGSTKKKVIERWNKRFNIK